MPDAEFQRGKETGAIVTQLAQHEARLSAINGAITKAADAMVQVGLLLQGITDRLDASAATVIATADALAKANAARREKEDNNWSPFAKTVAITGALGVLAGILYKVFGS